MDYSSQGLGGGAGGVGANGKLDPQQRTQLMNSVKQQLALAKAQELLQQVNDVCFKMCITKPGSSLSSSEQKCTTLCVDRYMDAWNLVAKSYGQRLQRELQNYR